MGEVLVWNVSVFEKAFNFEIKNLFRFMDCNFPDSPKYNIWSTYGDKTRSSCGRSAAQVQSKRQSFQEYHFLRNVRYLLRNENSDRQKDCSAFSVHIIRWVFV
jgi:hypothetical protein